jgi:Glycosyl transferase family 2
MRWVIITGMYNVADLAAEFCSYHLDLGTDKIFVADYGSDDGTIDLLAPFVRAGVVQVVPIPTHRFVDYDPSNALLSMVRAEDAGDWVSFLDPDEFLAGPIDLKGSLVQVWLGGVAAVKVPRANLIGIGCLPDTEHYLTHLNLKVVVTDVRIPSASADLSSPWIFSSLPPKVMLRANQSDLSLTAGEHDVIGAEQEVVTSSSLQILHLPVRSYESFKGKIEAGMDYFTKNPELGPGTGWHWRRWFALLQSGRLREEYESQFLEASAAESLLAEGQIVPETRLADWLSNERNHAR